MSDFASSVAELRSQHENLLTRLTQVYSNAELTQQGAQSRQRERNVEQVTAALNSLLAGCKRLEQQLEAAKQVLQGQQQAQRHMLDPSNELFVLGNAERELLAKQFSLEVTTQEEQEVMASLSAETESAVSLGQQDSFICHECRANLSTSHLLDVHLAEVHDSFFQAQVARRLPVFQCLVEGCGKTFVSPAHRFQHLMDLHSFPNDPELGRSSPHSQGSLPQSHALGGNCTELRAPSRLIHRGRPCRRHREQRAAAARALVVSSDEEVEQHSAALEQLYSDILQEKRRRLEHNFDASPAFDTGRADIERQWRQSSLATSTSGQQPLQRPTTSQGRRQQNLRRPGSGAARRRSARLVAATGSPGLRQTSTAVLTEYDASLSQTAEAHDWETLRRLLQVEDKLRASAPRSENADFYGLDLRPASVLPYEKYSHWGVDLPDLVAAGMLGLERAIEKFEPEKGFKFSTYAFWWIRQKISRCAVHQSRAVPIPIAMYDTINKIRKVRNELEMKTDEPVTDEQVAEAVGINQRRFQRCMQAARYEQSFDGAQNAKGSDERPSLDVENVVATDEGGDGITGDADAPEKSAMLQRQLDQLLNTLPPRDRNIIRMHYGLHHPRGEGMGLKDISRAYGVCHERVRKIEADAVQRLGRSAELAGVSLPFSIA
ncbi:hypothetical protein WJX73_003058 [Symbiochloris irregularis]|uniref:C2H2-type domain-containing protein n=1 Tax=Symbiochloris irregularis TaxID=706552 RepID=A0AAW1PE56_9CHLO